MDFYQQQYYTLAISRVEEDSIEYCLESSEVFHELFLEILDENCPSTPSDSAEHTCTCNIGIVLAQTITVISNTPACKFHVKCSR